MNKPWKLLLAGGCLLVASAPVVWADCGCGAGSGGAKNVVLAMTVTTGTDPVSCMIVRVTHGSSGLFPVEVVYSNSSIMVGQTIYVPVNEGEDYSFSQVPPITGGFTAACKVYGRGVQPGSAYRPRKLDLFVDQSGGSWHEVPRSVMTFDLSGSPIFSVSCPAGKGASSPGGTSCCNDDGGGGQEAGTLKTENQSIDLAIGMGGRAGRILYKAADFKDAMPDPSRLIYKIPEAASRLGNAVDSYAYPSANTNYFQYYLKHINSGDAIMDVQNITSNSFDMVVTSPTQSCKISLQRDPTNQVFSILRAVYGGGVTNVETNTYSVSGNELRLVRAGSSSQIVKITDTNTTGYTYVTNLVRGTNGNISARTFDAYTNNPVLGPILIRHTAYSDTNAAAISVDFTYCLVPNSLAYGQLTSWSSTDGSWGKYAYNTNGNMVEEDGPWKNSLITDASNLWKRTVYSYCSYNGLYVITNQTDYAPDQDGTPCQIGRQDILYSDDTNVCTIVSKNYSSASSFLTTTNQIWNENIGESDLTYLWWRNTSASRPDGTKVETIYSRGDYRSNGNVFSENTNGLAIRTVSTLESPSGAVAFQSTKKVSVTDEYNRNALEQTYVYDGSGYDGNMVDELRSEYDAQGHLTGRVENGAEVFSATYNSMGLQETATDEGGIKTDYAYDSAGRVVTMTREGGSFPDIVTTYSYDAADRVTQTVVSAGTLATTNSTTYDMTGRAIATVDEHGLSTSMAYDDTARVVTETMPGGGTRVTARFVDGEVYSETGTAVTAVFYDRGMANGLITHTTTRGRIGSPASTTEYRDWLGRTVIVLSPDPAGGGGQIGTTNVYNSAGQLILSTRTGGLAPLAYNYDSLGRQFRQGVALNFSSLDTSSDSIQETYAAYTHDSAGWWMSTVSRVYPTAGSTIYVAADEGRQGLVDVSGAQLRESRSYDVRGQMTRTVTTVNRGAKTKTVLTYRPGVAQPDTQNYYNGVLLSTMEASGRHLNWFYDALGRQTNTVDSDLGSSAVAYAGNGFTLNQQDAYGQKTSFGYDPATGRLLSQTNATGVATYFAYDVQGRVTNQWGGAVYPVSYSYDPLYGRRIAMTTYRTDPGWASATWPTPVGGDVTRWNYDEATGLLTNKLDAAINGVSYRYTSAGLMAQRTWARGITAGYGYDALGQLTNIVYGGSSPAVAFSHDRMGRLTRVVTGAATNAFGYDGTYLSLTNEVQSGAWGQASLTRRYDAQGRPSEIALGTGYDVTFGYDGLGRLNAVASGTLRASYGFAPDSDWMTTTTMSYTNQARLVRQVTRDAGGRITNVMNVPILDRKVSLAYGYDLMGRRTNVVAQDGTHWNYDYDSRSEVVRGARMWPGGSNVSGQTFAYGFDPIGNRTNSQRDGEAALLWSANNLNQYTSSDVSSQLHVFGTADLNATVTVSRAGAGTVTALRQGTYFHAGVTVTNSIVPVWAKLSVLAKAATATNIVSGAQFAAKTPEIFGYDADGNTTNDGRWVYSWDAENRLTNMVTGTDAVNAGTTNRMLAFAYDYMGRRISKTVYEKVTTNSSWAQVLSLSFVYDGWNLVSEVRSEGSAVSTNLYVWGTDLSGTMQGAGGVGGLLAGTLGTNGSVFYGGDANGNVILGIDAKNGAAVLSYECGPFAETLRQSGLLAEANPFRFSTKYTDDETGLTYYGYRYYSPRLAKWLTRDPAGERASADLMSFVNNDAIDGIDPNGLLKLSGVNSKGQYGDDDSIWVAAWVDLTPDELHSIRDGGIIVNAMTLQWTVENNISKEAITGDKTRYFVDRIKYKAGQLEAYYEGDDQVDGLRLAVGRNEYQVYMSLFGTPIASLFNASGSHPGEVIDEQVFKRFKESNGTLIITVDIHLQPISDLSAMEKVNKHFTLSKQSNDLFWPERDHKPSSASAYVAGGQSVQYKVTVKWSCGKPKVKWEPDIKVGPNRAGKHLLGHVMEKLD